MFVHAPCFVDGLEDKGVALGGGGASHRVGGVVRSNHFKLKGEEDQSAMLAQHLMSSSSPAHSRQLEGGGRSPYVV